ncbi:MAG: NAD(P)/FAD-dependent oxidoreductase [Bryobacteraceae bacterium]
MSTAVKKLDADVIVAGAGVAGLAAASELSSAGKSVLLIEARNRTGGRILTEFTERHPDLAIELGAEFIHGCHPTLYEFSRNEGIELSEVSGTSYRQSDGRLLSLDNAAEGFWDVLNSPDLARQDIAFSEFIQNASISDRNKMWTTWFVEGFNGAFADRISTKALYHQQQAEDRIDGENSWRIDSGYISLVMIYERRVRQSAQLLLDTTIRAIDWGRGSVRVNAISREGQISANSKAAIITVPLGVLLGKSPEAAIAFSPEPEIYRDLRLLDPGWAMRLSLVFSEPVWADAAPGASFIFSPSDRFPTWWTRPSTSGHLLTGWNGGPKAAALAGLNKDELVDAAFITLSALLGRDAADLKSKLESAHYHDWHNDPYSAGSYSYVTAGGFDFAQRASQPVEDTLWFAGEAMASDGYWGTVHGAIESGRRAASDLLHAAPKK